MPRYTVLVYPDEGNYSVVVPALDGCVTWGHTVDEALAMARDAIRLHLAGLVEDGDEVPEEDEPPMVATVDVPLPIAAKV
jgi:antitoxin HicB